MKFRLAKFGGHSDWREVPLLHSLKQMSRPLKLLKRAHIVSLPPFIEPLQLLLVHLKHHCIQTSVCQLLFFLKIIFGQVNFLKFFIRTAKVININIKNRFPV